jgi:uncharacterized membrane protein required for colicin V production
MYVFYIVEVLTLGTQFFWFYDVLLAAILLGVTYKCARWGFAQGVTTIVGTLLAFAVALGISAPAAAYIYDTWISDGVVEKITYATNLPRDATRAAFETLREVDMSKTVINGYTLEEFLEDSGAGTANPNSAIKLNLKNVDMSETGITSGDLRFFGLDPERDFKGFDAGNIDITASDRAKYDIEDILLARIVSMRFAQKAEHSHGTLTKNLVETLPGVTKATQNTVDLVAVLLLDVINSDSTELAEAINENLVRPVSIVPFRFLVFALAFALVSILVSVISNAMHLVDSLPTIGRTNTVLGGLMGVLLSCVIVGMVCVLVRIIVALTSDEIIFLNSVTIEETYVFRYIYDLGFLSF